MRISVIILNWNRPDDTLSAVRSVLAQQYTDVEVLVWDNASSDNSRRLLEQEFAGLPQVHLHFADTNYGVAGGRNRAFPLASGDVLLSLDSDATFENAHALSRVAQRLDSDPDIGAISFEVKRPDGHLMWPFSRPADMWRNREFETIRMDGCAFAVRKEAYDRAGGFAEHFSPYGAEDQHFAHVLIGLGYRVMYLPSVTVIHAFAPHGRTKLQFARHVRNSLWLPMELFPAAKIPLSVAKMSYGLLKDALEERQLVAYARGVVEAFLGFRRSRRRTIPSARWRHLRRLVNEDKDFARISPSA